MDLAGIESLPESEPVVYEILDDRGETIYTGAADCDDLCNCLRRRLPGSRGAIPGAAKVWIERMSSMDDARRKADDVVARRRPRYNRLEN